MDEPSHSTMDNKTGKKALAEHSHCIFHPRKMIPSEYFAVTEKGTILFTFTLLSCHTKKTKRTLVFFHGNGEIVEDYEDSDLEAQIRETMNMVLVEYRGYGYFSECKPDVIKIMNDVTRVQRALERNYGILQENCIIMGRSIGSLFAAEYAFRFPNIAGVIIESGFSSGAQFYMERLLSSKTKNITEEISHAMRMAADDILDNQKKLKNYSGPILIFHGSDDDLVPPSNAKELFAACTSEKKEMRIFEIGRHNVRSWNQEEYFKCFQSFIRRTFVPNNHEETQDANHLHRTFHIPLTYSIPLAIFVGIGAIILLAR